VAAKQADIAVGYQPQLHLQVNEGLPLVRIGTLVSTPLSALVVLADGPIKSIADLKGKKIGYSVAGFEDSILAAMLEKAGVKQSEVELINVNFSLSPAVISGQVDAVIGAYRNFELNQMELAGHPGRAFYIEEEGVPAYDELIYLAHKDDLARPELRRFLDATERAATWIVNHPDEAFDVFRKAGKDLDDELNRSAWKDTVPRFAHSPAGLDTARYARFAAFLQARGLIKDPPPVASYAVLGGFGRDGARGTRVLQSPTSPPDPTFRHQFRGEPRIGFIHIFQYIIGRYSANPGFVS
jgi:putative hydroxymethylpyrimidine transport system substrate-binding protein